jgi:hypothetical protein
MSHSPPADAFASPLARALRTDRPEFSAACSLPTNSSSPPLAAGWMSQALVSGARQVPRRLWQPDSEAERCSMLSCGKTFGCCWRGERKHHCRQCGRVVCADCSGRMVRATARPIHAASGPAPAPTFAPGPSPTVCARFSRGLGEFCAANPVWMFALNRRCCCPQKASGGCPRVSVYAMRVSDDRTRSASRAHPRPSRWPPTEWNPRRPRPLRCRAHRPPCEKWANSRLVHHRRQSFSCCSRVTARLFRTIVGTRHATGESEA